MKKPWLAFLLNFLIAGAGLAYLGKWAWAFADLAITLAIGFLLAYKFPSALNSASIILPVMNGVLARQIADQFNQRAQAQAAAAGTTPTALP